MVVRMRTQEPPRKPWNREGFFGWLDRRITQVNPSIPDMQTLAALSGVSHSALSNWRKGKYRPSLDSLSMLAEPLQVAKETVWAEAGIVPELEAPTTAEERWGEMMIRSSSLSDAAKERLLALHREDMRRQREEAERQLRAKIDLLTEQ
jgi:transcriptional regulator with XRE-family HTH domain